MTEDRLAELTSPEDQASFVIKEESIFGEDIPNQWSFKVKKIESVIFNPPLAEKIKNNTLNENVEGCEDYFVNIKKTLIIKNDGKAFITFDVSHFIGYTIYVINQQSDESIQFYVELSPDNIHFIKKYGNNDLQEDDTDYVTIHDLSQFVRVKLNGRPGKKVLIFLQAKKVIDDKKLW
ncbi:DUF6385 domain-containing protein [Peribacillus acanthi]|uniref:DUF6385 domain-containing protein n=1 Tax=Peribacillus acanthi TaxID=2171554 RepID=UPI000D3E4B28|nr:DUF6385 domain-containing protein [Peribacillus acanthi]